MPIESLEEPATTTTLPITQLHNVAVAAHSPLRNGFPPGAYGYEIDLGQHDINAQAQSPYLSISGTGYIEWPMFTTQAPETVDHTVQSSPITKSSAFQCRVCAADHDTPHELKIHALATGHVALKCAVEDCTFRFHSRGKTYREHLRAAHPGNFQCDQCMHIGKSLIEVAQHASRTGHAAFKCEEEGCEKKFSRIDTFQRHLRTHKEESKCHSCKHCKRYRAPHGFKRKDHLTQHLRQYHHIGEDDTVGTIFGRRWCPKQDCQDARPADAHYYYAPGTFTASAQWVTHMRKEQNESDFPCPRPGCDRIEGKGYFHKADLRSHLRKVHGLEGDLDI